MKGDTQTMMLFIAGLLFSLFIFFTFIFPSIIKIGQGACWTNANTMMERIERDMGFLNSGSSVNEKITLGDCVEKMVFANGNDVFTAVGEEVKCGAISQYSEDAVMVIMPTPSDLAKDAAKEGADKAIKKSVVTMEPICRKIQCDVSPCTLSGTTSPVVLDGPGDKGVGEYCVKILKLSSNLYSITSSEGTCGADTGTKSGEGVLIPHD